MSGERQVLVKKVFSLAVSALPQARVELDVLSSAALDPSTL